MTATVKSVNEVAGTRRRDQHEVTISLWRALTRTQIAAAEAEVLSLPLPNLVKPISVSWA